MRRREFITLLGGSALAWPFTARAQQRPKRIGVLLSYFASDLQSQARVAAFQTALQQLGWTEGRNVTFEFRYAEGKLDKIGCTRYRACSDERGRHPYGRNRIH